ncbi:MAG: hypothetical protein PHS45_04905 [Bacilli bacterium]|nr:hypothetical protein [Bacilli bacterium]
MNKKFYLYIFVFICLFFVTSNKVKAFDTNEGIVINDYLSATEEKQKMTTIWKSFEKATQYVYECLKETQAQLPDGTYLEDITEKRFDCSKTVYLARLNRLSDLSSDIIRDDIDYKVPYFNKRENRHESNAEFWQKALAYINTHFSSFNKEGPVIYKQGLKDGILSDVDLPEIEKLHNNIDHNFNIFVSIPNDPPLSKEKQDRNPNDSALEALACRNLGVKTIRNIQYIFNIVKILVPGLLILLGSFDMAKVVLAGNQDDIKKAQKFLIQRFLAGIAIYFVPTLINLLLSFMGITNASCSIS